MVITPSPCLKVKQAIEHPGQFSVGTTLKNWSIFGRRQHRWAQNDYSSVPGGLGATPRPQTPQSLCDSSCSLHANSFPQGPDGQIPFKSIINAARHSVERQLLCQVLEQTNNNKALAARLLQMDYKTLHSKLKFHKIPGKRGAPAAPVQRTP